MSQSKSLVLASAVSLLLMLSTATLVARHYMPSTPPLSLSLATPVSRVSDFTGISLGLRRITADIAWIQTLIYYGTEEEGPAGHEHDHAHDNESEEGKYLHLLAYCQRVARIDPNFEYIYYYGASVLGWNVNRPNEAEELLKEAIRNHPEEWRYKHFLAGIAYEKDHDINNLVKFLEVFIEDANCPNVLRSILASIYKKQKQYKKALRVWLMIYDTKDSTYTTRALKEIESLAQMTQIGVQK